MDTNTLIQKERLRIRAEYKRRDEKIVDDLYAPWQPGEVLMLSERKRTAASMLYQAGKFPVAGDRCLEVGCGRLGWLADLLSWGLRSDDLYGIELDAERCAIAHQALPAAGMVIGDAAVMPWNDASFDLVVVSTVFSSVLDPRVRNTIASEIIRILAPGGTAVLYDLSVNNPGNKNLRKVRRTEISSMFPHFGSTIKSLTLAPPAARFTAKQSWSLATILSDIPFLRTHLLAILVKP